MKKKILLFMMVLALLGTGGCKAKEYQVITGLILSAGPESFLIQVTSGSDEDLMQVHITDKTKFEKGIPALLEKGKTVSLSTDGRVLESYPVQVYAVRILTYE
ncbi:MAG: hypothetical protein R6W96_04920 [Clostridia bacterium]